MTVVVPGSIRVLMPDGDVAEMKLETYLAGAVVREMSADAPLEALKAQAVASRTYATSARRHPDVGADVCTTTHCQEWRRVDPIVAPEVFRAVSETWGMVAIHNGKLIDAFFFEHCDGQTRSAEDVLMPPVPYLQGVDCACGFVAMKGHGVGLCQRGAIVMARRGASFEQILSHYYRGVVVIRTDPGHEEQPVSSPALRLQPRAPEPKTPERKKKASASAPHKPRPVVKPKPVAPRAARPPKAHAPHERTAAPPPQVTVPQQVPAAPSEPVAPEPPALAPIQISVPAPEPELQAPAPVESMPADVELAPALVEPTASAQPVEPAPVPAEPLALEIAAPVEPAPPVEEAPAPPEPTPVLAEITAPTPTAEAAAPALPVAEPAVEITEPTPESEPQAPATWEAYVPVASPPAPEEQPAPIAGQEPAPVEPAPAYVEPPAEPLEPSVAPDLTTLEQWLTPGESQPPVQVPIEPAAEPEEPPAVPEYVARLYAAESLPADEIISAAPPPPAPEPELPVIPCVSESELPALHEEVAFPSQRAHVDHLPGPRMIAGCLETAGVVVSIEDEHGTKTLVFSGSAPHYGEGGFETVVDEDGCYTVSIDGEAVRVEVCGNTVFIHASV